MNVFKILLDHTQSLGYLGIEHVQLNPEEIMDPKNIIVWSYMIYLAVSITLTIWVARTLHKRGAIFLVDTFSGNAELAASVNHLLVVGFYLINVGFVCLALRTTDQIPGWRPAIEMLSDKLGFVLLTLGVMHFFNLFIFSRLRHRGHSPAPHRPPVAPDATLKIAVPR
jgi:hypothetical protein